MARRIKLRHKVRTAEAAKLLNPVPTHDPNKKKAIYPLYTREALMACDDWNLLQSIADFYEVKEKQEPKDDFVQALIEAQVRYRIGFNPVTVR